MSRLQPRGKIQLDDGRRQLFVWGDIVHLPQVKLSHHDAAIADDAVAARPRVLDWVASDRHKVAGAHLDFPSYGRIVRHGGACCGESV